MYVYFYFITALHYFFFSFYFFFFLYFWLHFDQLWQVPVSKHLRASYICSVSHIFIHVFNLFSLIQCIQALLSFSLPLFILRCLNVQLILLKPISLPLSLPPPLSLSHLSISLFIYAYIYSYLLIDLSQSVRIYLSIYLSIYLNLFVYL